MKNHGRVLEGKCVSQSEYNKGVRARAKAARAELAEFCTKPRNPARRQMSLRAVNYMTMRMGYRTVITGQMENWIFGHMLAFAWREVRHAKKGSR